jgi:DnaJ-domain-containing protein 1
MALTIIKEGSKVVAIALYKTIISTINTNTMTRDEACSILDINSTADKENIYKRYKELYEKNSENNNGSRYLQSKIKNAFKFLNKHK